MVELFTLKGVTIETRRPGARMAVYKQEVQHGAFLGTFRFVELYKKVLYTTV